MGLPGGFPDKAKIIVRHKFCDGAFLVRRELIKGVRGSAALSRQDGNESRKEGNRM